MTTYARTIDASPHRTWRRTAAQAVLCALITGLAACGGGGEATDVASASAPSNAAPVVPQVSAAAEVPSSPPGEPVPIAERRLPAATSQPAVALAAEADPGQLMLLVPDGLSPSDPGVTAWLDAASEVGTRIAVVTDSQFLSMGTVGALGYAGLVLPDSIHAIGSDDIVSAVRAYTQAGGKTFLTFDFAALTLNGDGVPVFPIPKSRLSDLAGVDYVLYDKYLDKTTGLGPVTAMRSTLRELLVPPGKSQAYPPATETAGSPVGVSVAPLSVETKARAAGSKRGVPLLDAAGVTEREVLYLAPSVSDAGGARGFDPQQFQMLPSYSVQERERSTPGAKPRRTVKIRYGRAFKGAAPTRSTRASLTSSPSRPLVASDEEAENASAPDVLLPKAAADAGPDERHAYSGYLLGYLIYPTYQTEGDYLGTTLAMSPDFGLVAGINRFGAGTVMFVNLPLTYLKGRTDALPMHGFLGYFVKNVLDGIRLSAMPKAIPGITFNWHLDSKAAQAPMLALEKAGIFKTAGTSMHMTAGPDTITFGDGAGFDLDHNPTAQAFLQRMVARGHSVGSHGGWIHDYYGENASETNEAQFLPFLVDNRRSVDGAIGRPSRDYSAPQGNNPRWAMAWLESQGVVGAYFGGHTGLGVTRQYRDGTLLNPNLWVSPVTPLGNYATFEEFQDFNVPKADVLGWYQSLIDFDIAQNTSRMIYAHPPGAYDWVDVMKGLIAYAASKGTSKFKWYSIERLADFMAKRNQVAWSEARLDAQTSRITATHPASLAEMAWTLPKERYLKPTNVSGAAVSDGGAYWLVRGKEVTTMSFKVKANPAYSGS